MSRPLVVSFLLLATIANAAVSTKYSCGYTTGCDDCVENKAASPVTQELGTCVSKDASHYTYECGADGTVQEVEYYDAQCKIQKGSPSSAADFACESSSSSDASLQVTKSGETAFTASYCQGSDSCSGSCITFDIKSASGGCTNVNGKSYKAKQLATGNAVLFISGYSNTGCQPGDLVFQGEFVAGSCTTLTERTIYKCDAPAHYTTKRCGLVESCSACSEATEAGKTLYGKCVNDTYYNSYNASYKSTCSDGKVTKTTFTDDQCTEQKSVTTTESCVYSDTMQYAKLSGSTLYICDSMKECSDASSWCSKYTPTSLDTTGKCVYDNGNTQNRFSYKATKNGDSYRIAVFGDRKCQKDLKIQGDFTADKCVAVRTATKTVCGAFAATTMLAASVIAAAMSLLLF